MSRRKKGEGSYGERIINGNKYRYYKFPDGKTVYGKTLKEVNEKRQAYSKLDVKSNSYTFVDYCYQWLKQKQRITQRTRDDYESEIELHIKPYSIGNRPINSLTPQMFEKYLNELSEKYSHATIKRTWAVVVQVIKYGMRLHEIPSFPLEDINKPTEEMVASKKKDTRFVTEEDVNAIYEEAKKEQYGNHGWLFIFIMYSGVRAAEAFNLKWKDVSSDYKKVHIRRSSQKVRQRDNKGNKTHKYKYVEKNTKTNAGDRIIPLPKRGTEALKKMAEREHTDEDLVFVNNFGRQYNHNMIIKPLKSILKHSDSKIKNYSPHDFRRGYGSILLSKGVNIAVISKLLGHSRTSITFNVYTKAFDKDVEAAVKLFD